MPKKKSDESTKSKSKKASKKSSPQITLDGAAVAPVPSLALPKPRRSSGEKKKTATVPELSRDDIARRAYYIAERRRHLHLPGDELGDWVEAEKQLRKEASR